MHGMALDVLLMSLDKEHWVHGMTLDRLSLEGEDLQDVPEPAIIIARLIFTEDFRFIVGFGYRPCQM